LSKSFPVAFKIHFYLFYFLFFFFVILYRPYQHLGFKDRFLRSGP